MSFRRLSLLAIIAFFVAVMSLSIAAARADEWSDKQEETHKDDWDVKDRPDGAMYQILRNLALFQPPESWAKGICQLAALNAAWDAWGSLQGNATIQIGGDTTKGAISNIWGIGKEGLEEYLSGVIKDGYKDLVKGKIKDFFKGRKVKADVYKWSGHHNNCDYVVYVIVDIPNSVGTVLVHGNCNCSTQRCYKHEQSTKLSGFEIKLVGKINYSVGKHKIESVELTDLKKEEFKAICDGCDKDHATTGPKKGVGLTDGPTGGGTTGGGTTGGGVTGGGTNGGGADGGGGKKPEEKTCTPCESIARQLEEAETKRDNFKRAAQNLQNGLTDVDNGVRPKSDREGLERDLKTMQDAVKEQEGRIRELEEKKDKCEKGKCGHHASRLIEEGATGYAASRTVEEASHHARGGQDDYQTADRPQATDSRPATEDTPPQRDSHGCVASASATEKLPANQRAAAAVADKARLDAEVSQREAAEKQVSKKYDDALAELERRRYSNFVTSDETYTSQKIRLRSKRREETESYHDATVRARECRDNYLKAAQ